VDSGRDFDQLAGDGRVRMGIVQRHDASLKAKAANYHTVAN
jgi:hypothetical protein